MMDSHDWGEMAHQYGHEFNGHWLDAMIANHSAQIALCRAELRSGASPQARALARAMLATAGRTGPAAAPASQPAAHRDARLSRAPGA
jgi:uncharacterized protein (DUF305 family)